VSHAAPRTPVAEHSFMPLFEELCTAAKQLPFPQQWESGDETSQLSSPYTWLVAA